MLNIIFSPFISMITSSQKYVFHTNYKHKKGHWKCQNIHSDLDYYV